MKLHDYASNQIKMLLLQYIPLSFFNDMDVYEVNIMDRQIAFSAFELTSRLFEMITVIHHNTARTHSPHTHSGPRGSGFGVCLSLSSSINAPGLFIFFDNAKLPVFAKQLIERNTFMKILKNGFDHNESSAEFQLTSGLANG